MQATKRGLSILLTLALMVSLFSGLTLGANAAASSYNTGTRHETCTSLSPDAEAYYTGSYTWDKLSAMSGVSTDSSLAAMDSELFSALHTLMSTNFSSITYSALTSYYPYTDGRGSTSSELMIYSDVPCSGTISREHVWPKSRASFYQKNGGSDLSHLRPEESTVNSTRGNHTMGNVLDKSISYSTKSYGGNTVLWYNASYSSGNCKGIVEVKDDVKGDLARILLYVYVRWQQPNLCEYVSSGNLPQMDSDDSANDGSPAIESLDTLLEWCRMDPVDTWEMGRNDVAESVQGTRNVFIDYPELAWMLFGREIPANMETPSGYAASGSSSYTVSAVSSNNSLGTVSLSGNLITCAPAEGYYVASAAVSPASAATATINGNTVTLSNITADCTVTVNFAKKTALTVSYSENGSIARRDTVYAGDAVTLPTAAAIEGYSFVGWLTAPLDETTAKPECKLAGEAYTVSANTTLYAVYRYSVDQGSGGSGNYVKVTDAPTDWSGEYVIVYEADQYVLDGSLTSVDAAKNYHAVTITDNMIAADAADPYKVTIAPMDDRYSIQCASGKYIGIASDTNGLTSSDSAMKNTIGLSDDGTADIISSAGAHLRYNATSGQERFRYYKSGTYNAQKAVCLYVKDGTAGTICYSTTAGEVVPCEHLHTTETNVPATCTTDGSVTVTCDDCGKVISTTVLQATGHTFGAWASNGNGTHTRTCQTCGESETADCTYTTVVTPPTETEQGYTTYTCDVCGAVHVGNYVPALGEKQTVAFVVPAGVTAVEDMTAYVGDQITLPAAEGTPTADAQEYTFAGWVAEEVDNSTEAPTILKAGDSYTVSASTTLYALYTYAVADGGGSTEYTLVTDATQLSIGANVVIAAKNSDTAISTEQKSNNRAEAAVTKTGDTLSFTGNVAELTLGAGTTDGTYSFYDEANSGYLYAASSSSNYLRTESTLTDNSSWQISIDADSIATVVAQGAYTHDTMQYNLTSKLFACYSGASQKAISLYIKAAASTTYYTTVLGGEVACSHANTTETTIPATCTTDGSVTVTCVDCGEVISTTVLAATGHSYDDGVVTTKATCTTDGVMTFTCAACGDSYTTAIPATGHTVVTDPAVPATCTTDGLTEGSHCSVCDAVLVAQVVVPATGHTYAYTDNGDGTHTVSCANCDYSAVEDHTFADGECVCGAKETVEDPYLDETLVIYSKSLNLQSYIGVDYTVRNKVAANYDSFYVAVSVGDGEEQVLEPISAGSYTYFELKTTATQMTENLTATLYAVKDGVTYHGQSVEWNVRDGIMDKIAAIKDLSVEKNLQQMTLMVDMLNYGAAAQIRFNNRVDDLANNKLTDEHKAYATTTNPELTATITQTDNGDNRVTFFSENLSLESSIEFAITLKTKGMDVANLEAHISYGTTEDVVALTPFNGTYSVLNYNKLACNQLREPVSITIYDKTTGKPVSATLNCSAEAIAATMVGTQADIIYATMRYGDSAEAFYG